MSHPVGTHISKEQPHELEHWLKKHKLSTSIENQKKLCNLIDHVKTHYGKKSTQHLTHNELDSYYLSRKKK
ncbi:hypothetical protein ACTXA3_05325 [Proteus mirabilis]|uniref:hypothetical protein n=1 Tax=Proteus mirabilis TaxID=584 RepID=UPI0018C72AD6|nr:hypothetical protein [Proteus mirabilis]MBG6016312.1 hypothetical protein [Proteus mirabilis]MBU9980039.1 hypothetical protein [Proteus mirabilis]MDX4951115.1 hypothetical protein [Proteus mirabilis]